MAKNFVIVCKTYKNDFSSFCRMFDSFIRFNADGIQMYVSVPEDDIELFANYVSDKAVVISDESYAKKYFATKEYWGLSLGYLNQEICKLSFWETEIARNYLFIDSDVYFIRDFHLKDFMADYETPYSVLVMDKDLHTEVFYTEYGTERKAHIARIFEAIKLEDRRMLTCHGMTVFSTEVLKDFKKKFMKPKHLTYSALLEISPFEYSWYNAWLQKSGIIKIVNVEPFFKTYHMRIEYLFSRARLITENHLAGQYVGIVLNSNWQKGRLLAGYERPRLWHRLTYRIVSKLG